MTEVAGDIEPTVKNWAISVVGAGVHVCYSLPHTWDLSSKPALVVVLLDEGYTAINPTGDVLMQFDCWAGVREKAIAAALKATMLEALYALETVKYIDPDTGNMIASAYNTHALWAPDLTTTTPDGASAAGPTPRYSITTQLVTGKAPVTV
jgi:hypothetical protein